MLSFFWDLALHLSQFDLFVKQIMDEFHFNFATVRKSQTLRLCGESRIRKTCESVRPSLWLNSKLLIERIMENHAPL